MYIGIIGVIMWWSELLLDSMLNLCCKNKFKRYERTWFIIFSGMLIYEGLFFNLRRIKMKETFVSIARGSRLVFAE